MFRRKTAVLVLSLSGVFAALPASAQGSTQTLIALGTTPTMGSVLTDAQGKTLYVLLTDSKNPEEKKAALAACDKACLSKWAPVRADGRPLARDLMPGLLGSVKRADGTGQATYRDWPLYVYADDTKAGEVNGQGYLQVAYVISPVGAVNKSAPKSATASAKPAAVKPVDPAMMALGQEKFAATCAGCHGSAGQGAFGAALAGFPRLANDNAFIRQILVGSGDMPGFAGALSDKDVAAVATYARNSWGNQFGPIDADQVKPLR